MATISRLKAAEISNGNVINADDIEAELDQLVGEANSKETRLDDLETGTMTITGVKTFGDGINTDTISEETATAGVTIDGVLLKDNFMGAGYLSGAGVNAQTGTTYTVLTGDRNKLVTFSNASAVAVTLPQAGSAGFADNYVFSAVNRGAGLVTITPTTSTIDGASTLTLATNQGVMIFSDGTNYFTNRGRGKTNGWEPITTSTFSGQTVVAFNGVLDATNYSQIQVYMNIKPDTDPMTGRPKLQLGNGGTYETGATDYTTTLTYSSTGQTLDSDAIDLGFSSSTYEAGGAAGEQFRSVIDVFKGWESTSQYTAIKYHTNYDWEGNNPGSVVGGGRRNNATAAHTDLRIIGASAFSGFITIRGFRDA